MDLFDAIRLRRSVKPEHLKPDPVDPGLIEKLLDAANWAPSHGKTEPWRFTVFTGEGRYDLLEAICRGLAEDGQATLPDDDPRRQKLTLKISTAPVAITISVAPDPSPKILDHEELASTAMAVQNMHLAARALGLAGFWSSGAKAFTPQVAELLGLEPPARCLGFFFVGYPKDEWPEGKRRPWQEKVQWHNARAGS